MQAKEIASAKALGQKTAWHSQGTTRPEAGHEQVKERILGDEGSWYKDCPILLTLNLIFH